MNRLLLLAVSILPSVAGQATSNIADLGWMAGSWSGMLGKAVSEEVWTAPAGGAMLGMSRVVAGDRMAFFEYMRIEKRADGIYFVAQPGGKPPTSFKLTKSTGAMVVFENPAHDHPKIVTYRLEGGDLMATIEGDEGGKHVKQDFRFQRVKAAK